MASGIYDTWLPLNIFVYLGDVAALVSLCLEEFHKCVGSDMLPLLIGTHTEESISLARVAMLMLSTTDSVIIYRGAGLPYVEIEVGSCRAK